MPGKVLKCKGDIPGYKHRYDAFGMIGGMNMNLAQLSNNDFKKVVIDVLCHNGFLKGTPTAFQLACDAVEAERERK